MSFFGIDIAVFLWDGVPICLLGVDPVPSVVDLET